MTAQEQLFALYKKCFEQREVLTEAPALTIEIDSFAPDTFDFLKAHTETGKVISYLLSVKNVDKMPIPDVLAIVERTYQSQPFWKNLILDYLSFLVQKEAEELAAKAEKAKKEAMDVLMEIKTREAEQNAMIKAYSDPLKAQNFAIDGVNLITNYLNMCRKDAKKAWDVLVTNPGYFSPIITTDKEGKTILSPDQAKTENKKIASFLKGLSV